MLGLLTGIVSPVQKAFFSDDGALAFFGSASLTFGASPCRTVPGPQTIYRYTHRIACGHWILSAQEDFAFRRQRFWIGNAVFCPVCFGLCGVRRRTVSL